MSRRRAAPKIAAPTMTLAIDHAIDAVVASVTVPAGTTSLWLSRVGPSETIAYVRGANPLTITAAGLVHVRDFEPPIGVPVTYTAIVGDSGGVTSTPATASITIPSEGCSDTWLTDIAAPTNTFRVIMEKLEELEYEETTGIHYVLNRRTPIVTSDLARAPKFELNILTETDEEREKARAALGNGVPILLRTPPENGIGSLYLMATGWKEQRLLSAAVAQDRRFIIAAVQVDRPDPILYSPSFIAHYAAIRDAYSSYAELEASRDTYDDVLHDPTGAQAADLVPWPPTDV